MAAGGMVIQDTDSKEASQTPIHAKPSGYTFFEQCLRSPKYIVAPMVDQSEHAWRVLSRRYGAQCCFTPMFHARLFSDPEHGQKYRDEVWSTSQEDRPLVVQFCANDPTTLLRAAQLVEDQCDAVDLNLGCPQHIARKGRYGSYLQDEWDLIYRMVNTLHINLKVPVTVKIRVFPEVSKTIEYAKMIERAGAQMLTVHGRLREQKGHNTGLADWSKIKAVKNAVSIPVIANGNLLYFSDIERCLAETGADGVMSAEGNLYNPAIFADIHPNSYDMALEYLDICEAEQPNKKLIKMGPIRAHMFKIFHAALPKHTDIRSTLARVKSFDEMKATVQELADRLRKEQKESGEEGMGKPLGEGEQSLLRWYPHWRCQPYIRPPNKTEKSANSEENSVPAKRNSSQQEDGESKRLKESNEALLADGTA